MKRKQLISTITQFLDNTRGKRKKDVSKFIKSMLLDDVHNFITSIYLETNRSLFDVVSMGGFNSNEYQQYRAKRLKLEHKLGRKTITSAERTELNELRAQYNKFYTSIFLINKEDNKEWHLFTYSLQDLNDKPQHIHFVSDKWHGHRNREVLYEVMTKAVKAERYLGAMPHLNQK